MKKVFIAAIAAFTTSLVQLQLHDLLRERVFLLLYPTVFLAGFLGGLRAGLSATTVAVISSLVLFFPPIFQLPPKDVFALLTFTVTGICFSIFCELAQRNRAALLVSQEQLKTSIEKQNAFLLHRKKSEQEQHFLSEITKVLITSLNSDEMLKRFAKMSIPLLGDICSFDIIGNDGKIRRACWAFTNPELESETDAVMAFVPDLNRKDHPITKALVTKTTTVENDITGDWLKQPFESTRSELWKQLNLRKMMCVPLLSEGNVLGVLTFASSQNETKYTNEEVQLAHELAYRATIALKNALIYEKSLQHIEELNSEKEIRELFVNAITHDLRTPLTAAKMSAQLISRYVRDPDKVSVHAYKISQTMDRADRMIRDLLDANSLRAGQKLPITTQPCDLKSIVESSLEELATVYGNRFVFHADGNTEANIDCDAVKRILENLCSNAVKYGDNTTQITVHLSQRTDTVELSVANRGRSIPEADQASLFDYFNRAPQASTSGQKGWGIGLTLVRGVAEAHGGKVSVISNPSKGTIFTISLPRNLEAKALSSCPEASA